MIFVNVETSFISQQKGNYNIFFKQKKSLMIKMEKIRNQIIQNKRRSIFSLRSLEQGFELELAKPCDRNTTIDSESNFSLFPILDSTQQNSPSGSLLESNNFDLRTCQKVQLRPFLKEKRNKRSQEGEQRCPSFRQSKKYIENVTSMTARPFIPSIRINKTVDLKKKSLKASFLSDEPKVSTTVFVRSESRSKRSPTKSPKKFRRTSRTRKVISPKKNMSPTRKFSISAWEIPMEQLEF